MSTTSNVYPHNVFIFIGYHGNMSTTNNVYQHNAYVTHTDKHYTKRFQLGAVVAKYRSKTGVYPLDIAEYNPICSNAKQNRCRIRCLPYFFLLGVAKSGTSDLYTRIIKHPLVYKGTTKENFHWTQYRFLLNATLGDYSDLFDGSLSEFINSSTMFTDSNKRGNFYPQALGDFTTITFSDDVWWRKDPRNQGLRDPKYLNIHDIYNALPKAKLIVILRNPTKRLYSSYYHFRRKKRIQSSPQDFHLRVVKSIEWWHNCTVIKRLPRRACAYGSPPEMPPVACVLGHPPLNNWWYGEFNTANYTGEIRKGMYIIFLKDWLSVFPKEQLLLLKTEEYSEHPLNVINNTILPFLQLPNVKSQKVAKAMQTKKRRNTGNYKPMLPETQGILDAFYKPFNYELAEYLGDDKWLWEK